MGDERDPKVSQRYRELPAEEPTRELDQTILAAAHRSVDKPHAPLVTPAGRHRWYYAFGAAAILVLAVAVTVQMERQQPDPELASAPAAREEQAPMRQEAAEPPAAPRSRPQQAEPRAQDRSSSPAAPAAKIPQAAEPSAGARADQLERRREAAADAAPPAGVVGGLGSFSLRDEPPERWIERIVELRRGGRHEEADKLLAEFKQRFPDYTLPENVVRP